MTDLTLSLAQELAERCLQRARELDLKPLTVAVLDAAGNLKVLLRQDGTSFLRPDIAQGKARGAIGMGLGSRALYKRAQEQPYFIQAMNSIAGGSLVPVPGGVLIRKDGVLIGAIGITGDSSDNDEACAVHAIEALGLTADPG
ncbi:heme-binding protein [Paracoccus sp. WLY502]|uniref:GlcG/HbpS family heme-binding protein n=1 Tax=Paracoccus yibinensis TaxID=3068891 RepID=UPI002796BD2A|nr:heme-binding protein [Paracoccus sp. WLY502]MDQ1902169.1 heme-binding protein [Paracoccus sp. WLY502]